MTITTTITPDAKSFPYSTLSPPLIDSSAMPIGEVHFTIPGASVDAGGVAEDQHLRISCLLPINFAYVIVESNFTMEGNGEDAGNWNRWGNGLIRNSSVDPGRVTSPFLVDGHSVSTSFGSTNKTWQAANLPNGIWFVPSGNSGQVNCTFDFHNLDLDGGQTFVGFNVRFLQYKIAQAHHAVVNAPTLVR